jgi:hypothetical protein
MCYPTRINQQRRGNIVTRIDHQSEAKIDQPKGKDASIARRKEEVKARNIREKTQVKDTRARRANPSQDLATTWASTICKMQLKMTLMRLRILKISRSSFKKSIMTKMSWPI